MFELKEVAYYTGIAIPSLAFIGYLANKFYFSGGVCKSKNRLDGKVVIITGANTGIGYETALDLVKRGARVILACRDLKKADTAADKIRLETGSKNVFVEQIDLSSFESIRDFTRRFKANFTRLDILINNAGLLSKKRAETKDGFELHFGVIYLGHYLLTGLLINYLKDSAPSRIINLSGKGNFGVEMKWDDLQSFKDYSCIKACWRAQLANCLFSIELAKRFGDKGITAVTLCPGSVRTEVLREVKSDKDWIWLLYNIFKPVYLIFTKSPKEGAHTTIHCAVDDDIPNNNGKFFSDCKVIPSSPQSVDENSAKKLWEISEKLTGFEY